MLRALTDLDEDLVVASLDGIGAYDHITRSSKLSKLKSLPRASATLPPSCGCSMATRQSTRRPTMRALRTH